MLLMFCDAYCCLSKHATGSRSRSILFMHSNINEHVSHNIPFLSLHYNILCYDLQAMKQLTGWQQLVLSKYKTFHVTCNKLFHDIYDRTAQH